ncbi:MAG: hypothetical protein Q8R24_04965 [Legionellaceae bacterium]|nr:hypothetical protein [Legionellaceae bacterium]
MRNLILILEVFIMRLFKSVVDNLPQSVVANLPSTEQISSALSIGIGTGLSIGVSTAIRMMLNVNLNCSEAGYANIDLAITQAAFESTALMLGTIGLIQAQKAFGMDPGSAFVGGECCAALLINGLIQSRALSAIPAMQCSNVYEHDGICGYSR